MWNEGSKAFEVAENIAAYRRVKINSSGLVEYSDDEFAGHGVSMSPAKLGEVMSVKFLTSPGTLELEASGAIDRGAKVYAAADGKIQALPTSAGTYCQVGTALEEATNTGDVVEILADDHVSTAVVSE